MKNLYKTAVAIGFFASISCSDKLVSIRKDPLKPTIITQKLPHDTDDPAIWINPVDASKSLIIGTDKDTEGGLYAFDLKGTIVGKSQVLKRPNNVDIVYGLFINGKKIDIAVTTERETNKIRIFTLPELQAIDNGGISVFEGEELRAPMGIAIYTRKTDNAIFAVVGRKNGPSGTYLWQYQLSDNGKGEVQAKVVRKFGNYSGKKEIEAIAVDNDLGFVYYSDEQFGIRKYYADPALQDNTELAIFGQGDFVSDNEGIAIYNTSKTEGYILVSNQQANTFMVYPREGAKGNKNQHSVIAEIPTNTIECDGADVTNLNLGGSFSQGLFVAMSNGKTFHYYSWEEIQKLIDSQKK